jgi:hypothetical protein
VEILPLRKAPYKETNKTAPTTTNNSAILRLTLFLPCSFTAGAVSAAFDSAMVSTNPSLNSRLNAVPHLAVRVLSI